MYVPAHFAAEEDEVAAFVEQAGAADLVTFDGTRPVATLLPVIWDRSAGQHGVGQHGVGQHGVGQHGRLLGHMALANPQWRSALADVPALAIVHGPQAYISPSWYVSSAESGRAVPTWNYTSVHFTGQVSFPTDPDWLREVVTALTERYEQHLPNRWWITDAPQAYIAGQLRGIVGVEMLVSQVEAKAKLSQNRSQQDRAAVIDALRGSADPQAQQIAGLMAGREPSQAG